MKKILFTIACCLCVAHLLQAQDKTLAITATSTADDCVNFINNVAKKNNGKDGEHDFIRNASFTGGTFSEIQDWKYSQIINTFSSIDWSGFKKIDTSKGEFNYFIMFWFTSKTIIEERIKIDNKTNLVKERKNEPGVDYFYITIPFSEENKIKELEAAAKRLSQIVIAKGNIFKTTTPTSSKIKNIEGKPSFQETVKYINTFLNDGASDDLFCNGVKFMKRSAIVGEHIDGVVYVNSSYLWESWKAGIGKRKTENYRIDLSNVEEIIIVRGEGFNGGCCQFGLWFVEKGQAATPKMHLPLWNYSNSTNTDVLKEQKIYKAFNHLRQLCGAPEPISF